MSAQHHPRDNGHVVIGANRGAATGACRPWGDQGQARGQPVGHDVEKRAEAQAADDGEEMSKVRGDMG